MNLGEFLATSLMFERHTPHVNPNCKRSPYKRDVKILGSEVNIKMMNVWESDICVRFKFLVILN